MWIMSYLFGPVLSRRLGLSLGVDLFASKTCNLDCVYCELGSTTCITCQRSRFVPPEAVLREIRSRSSESFDFFTFAGSGEPTLSSDLGRIVREAKEVVSAPIAIITNSSLLSSPAVREEIMEADVVLPSLDAIDQRTFEIINRPATGLRIEEIIQGLREFRAQFNGEIWLEVMLVRGINDGTVKSIAYAVESIEPDRIQLNTVVRPPAEPVEPLSEVEMEIALQAFPGAELIPDWDWSVPRDARVRLIELLSRRPCTIQEVSLLTSLSRSDALKYVSILERDGQISRELHEGMHYFRAALR
jgi:wyosine [tRNA(Phe)-imidazoG37] synthetase (radical SAM superfamily)